MSANSEAQACVTVGLPEGLHMRPLAMLAKAANTHACEIVLRKGEQTADAKRPLDLMALVAECGDELWIEATGEGADAAVAHLASIFASNFSAEDA